MFQIFKETRWACTWWKRSIIYYNYKTHNNWADSDWNVEQGPQHHQDMKGPRKRKLPALACTARWSYLWTWITDKKQVAEVIFSRVQASKCTRFAMCIKKCLMLQIVNCNGEICSIRISSPHWCQPFTHSLVASNSLVSLVITSLLISLLVWTCYPHIFLWYFAHV